MNKQTIAAYGANLVPFRAVAADANFMAVTPSGFGKTGPTFNVQFGVLTPEVPAVPGKPAAPQQSGPNRPDYVPAQPATPDIPAVPATFAPQRSETLVLTQDEWDLWDKTHGDEAYILGLAAKRFGVAQTP